MNAGIKYCLVFIFYATLPFALYAQKSKAQLEKEKKDNLKKIEETNQILEETKQQKTATIGQLTTLTQKVNATERLIRSIQKEVSLLDNEMSEIEDVTRSMERDLVELKKEYAVMIYTSSKLSNNNNQLLFIFSSKSFNELFMRLKFLEQYSEERKMQVEQISKVKDALLKQRSAIRNKRIEKNNLLASQRQENSNLVALKVQQDNLVNELSKKEVSLAKELKERKAAVDQLEKLIASIIEKEIRKNSKGTADGKYKLTPEAELLSSSFEGNKSRLIWPVERGFISQKFGVQQHPVLKGIQIDNSGIEIQTNKDELARAVFDGRVEMVIFIPGMGTTVMLNHGEYFTIYSRLSSVRVKKEQTVKAKDVVGEVMTDKDGITELHFEIWKNMNKLDPEGWLYSKN